MSQIDNSEILFILNPNSGKRHVGNILNQLNQIDPDIAFVETKNTSHLEKTFATMLPKYKAFVIVGGDGSVNEALKYLVNQTDKFLCVCPNGSGNGFAYELGFKNNLKSLIRDINKAEVMSLDVIDINKSLFVNTAGIGIDSFIAHAFSKTKKRGLANYILLSIKSFFSFKPFKASLKINEKSISGRYQMITIANTRQFGNKAYIAPMARPNDGQFEVVLVKPFPFYLFPSFVLKMFRGTLKPSKYIEYHTTKGPVTVNAAYNKAHIDGEPVIFNDEIKIALKKKHIQVIKTAFNKL